MVICSTAPDFDAYARIHDGPCVLVPTMGALHEGHASLIRAGAALAKARRLPGGCVVTLFVNPTQFNEPSDFERYPRTLDHDATLCRQHGAACLFAPGVRDVYPLGSEFPVTLPPVAAGPRLEDALRPGHFRGVVQVVGRLFEMTRPAAAIFGEKDWQQLQVVRAMGSAVEIIPGPTIRESDGLAMSSRNRFLTPGDRVRATVLQHALQACQQARTPAEAERVMADTLRAQGVTPDYAVVRHAETLLPSPTGPFRALIAAKVGSVRLLDNGPWPRA